VPLWADKAKINSMLESQAKTDPTSIFGDIPVMVLEEVFRVGPQPDKKRLRRNKESIWTGADLLSEKEDMLFKKQMGYI